MKDYSAKTPNESVVTTFYDSENHELKVDVVIKVDKDEYHTANPPLNVRTSVRLEPYEDKNFEDYFWETKKPQDPMIDVLPWNIGWYGIPPSFLDCFIDSVKPVKAFLLNRHSDWRQKIEVGDTKMTKLKAYERYLYIKQNKNIVSEQLQDDVVILAKITPCDNAPIYTVASKYAEAQDITDKNLWAYFSYSFDVREQAIGRFYTTDNDDVVIKRFTAFAKRRSAFKGINDQCREIPIDILELKNIRW
jgi:hypothetical protein